VTLRGYCCFENALLFFHFTVAFDDWCLNFIDVKGVKAAWRTKPSKSRTEPIRTSSKERCQGKASGNQKN